MHAFYLAHASDKLINRLEITIIWIDNDQFIAKRCQQVDATISALTRYLITWLLN